MQIRGLDRLHDNIQKLLRQLDDRSVVDCLMEGGFVFEAGAKERITQQGLVDTGALRASVETREDLTARVPTVVVGPTVAYAAIHEFGGVVHPAVTPRMRRWAWRMFRVTGDPMYRGIALTRKPKLTIRIRARPYMRPTFDEDRDKAERAVQMKAEAKIKRLFGD